MPDRSPESWSVRGHWGLLLVFCAVAAGCGSNALSTSTGTPSGSTAGAGAAVQSASALSILESTALAGNVASGDTEPVRDPSVAFQNGTYYLFSTDPANPPTAQYLPIRCSSDFLNWKPCGSVFNSLPKWVQTTLPGVGNLWAPDISYFNGQFHLYYAASTLGTQISGIGLATNITLDPSDPNYKWVDQGEVISSQQGDDFNAIDPNILVDSDQRIWMTYGSFWTGIKQQEIDPETGMLLASNAVRNELAYRPDSPDHAEEGASLIHHGSYYYLFLSVDHCCAAQVSGDDYKEIVGRSTSPNGPFLDAQGVNLLDGGGSIVLEGNNGWLAPGGGTAFLDPQSGQTALVFHALQPNAAGTNVTAFLWTKTITWVNDWPDLD